MKNVRGKINDTLEEITTLKREIRLANVHGDQMLNKAYTAIKQVEETLEMALGDIAGSVDEIKERLEGLNAEFFTQIFSGVVQGLKDELAEKNE